MKRRGFYAQHRIAVALAALVGLIIWSAYSRHGLAKAHGSDSREISTPLAWLFDPVRAFNSFKSLTGNLSGVVRGGAPASIKMASAQSLACTGANIKQWIGGNGSWATASNWQGGQLPDSNSDVCIPAGVTVTVPTGLYVAATITNNGSIGLIEGARLSIGGDVNSSGTVSITGGSTSTELTVNGAFSSSGSVSIANSASADSGATLNINRASTFTGPFSFNGGVLGGAGLLTLNGSFTWSGGLIDKSVTANGGMSISGFLSKRLTGTLTNNGTATASIGTSSPQSGIFINPPGSTFSLIGPNGSHIFFSQFKNQGTIIRAGSGNAGIFRLEHTGTILVQAGTFSTDPQASTSFINQGTITVQSGGELHNVGVFSNLGTVTIQSGGAINQFSSASYRQVAGSTVIDGTFLDEGSISVQGGTFSGRGLVHPLVNNSGGQVNPGSALGALTISRGYTQGAGGTLNIELGGISNYDQIVTTPAYSAGANLNGTLNISLATGFVPSPGQSFTIVNATSRTGVFANVNGLNYGSGVFTLIYTANAVILTSCATPSITPLNNQSVCPGGTANFSTTASLSAEPFSFVWKKNGAPLSNGGNVTITTAGNTSNLAVANAQAADVATYTVEVAGVCGSPATSSATLALSVPPTITAQPANQTVCVGAFASFSASASGTGPLTYQWRKGGANINGATSSTYNIAAVTTDDAGTYDVVVSGACSPAATSAAATLIVTTPPVGTLNTIVVTTTANSIAADGQCSLREAIINANNDTATYVDCTMGCGADRILLQAGATYTLLNTHDNTEYGFNGLPAITSQITIEGNGATITRSNTESPRFRFFHITSTGNLTLRDVVLSNGLAQGGLGNSAGGGGGGGGAGLGGAIYNRGTLTAINITLSGNRAVGGNGGSSGGAGGGAGGGGLGGEGGSPAGTGGGGGGGGFGGNGGRGSVYTPAGAAGGGGGGTITNGGNASGTIGGTGGTLNGGKGGDAGQVGANGGVGGGGGGGGNSNFGTFRGGNGGVGGGGGGGAGAPGTGGAGGSGGFGGGGGGGGCSGNGCGSSRIGQGGNGGFGGGGGGGTDSSGGVAGFGGGRGGGSGPPTTKPPGSGGGGGGAGLGGAIFNDSGVVVLVNSTISANTAQGGAGGNGYSNSNLAKGGGGGSALGAGVYNHNGSVTITHCTLTGNILQPGNGGTGPGGNGLTGSATGGAVYSQPQTGGTTTLTLTNSILANSSAGQDAFVAGTITGSNNLIESNTGVPAAVIITTADPLLGPLTLNTPGLTPTHALALNSPAIDQGAAAGLTSDQRGVARPLNLGNVSDASGGDGSDLGSYEFEPTCPNITLSPPSLPAGRVSLAYNQTITASGGTAPYSFAVTDGNLPGGLSLSPTGTLSGTPNASGTFNFTVTATDANNCTGAQAYTLTVEACIAPTITALSNQTACAGATVNFSTTAAGTGPFTFVWKKNGAPLSSGANITITTAGNTSSLAVANAQATDAATYTVEVTGVCGTTATSSATLTVNTPPAVITQPASVTTCEGQAATFAVSATGTGLSYQWRKNGNNISGATGSSYTIAAVTPNDAGSYDVVVSGTCSPAAISTVATLTVNSPPAITAQPASVTKCEGQSATFSVGATGTGLTYQWRKNGQPIPGATGSSHTIAAVSANDAGAYDVVVSGTCSPAITSASAALTVNAPPAITAQPLSLTLCEGQGATFNVTATGTALTYQWRKNGMAITGATASTYAITAVSTSDAGTYDVVVSGTCSPPATSAAATLTVNTPTVITAQPSSQTVCPGTATSFTVTASGTGPFTYQWRKNGSNITGASASTYSIPAAAASDAGAYDVVVTGACGSATSNAATLTVNAATSIATHPASQSKIVGESVTFSVAATGTNLSYQWRKGGSTINGATASSYTISFVTLADASNYDVVVSGTCGNLTSNVAVLTVTCPTITVTPATLLVGTVGLPYTPTSFSATGGNGAITFSLTGALPNGMSLMNGQLAGTPIQQGSFPITITATDAYGCSASKDYTLVVNCPSIVISPSTLPMGLLDTTYPTRTFEASAGNAPYTFSLSGTLPTGMSFSGTQLSGTPRQHGNFSFTVNVTDKYGCTQNRGYTLTINRPPVALCQNVIVTAGAACSADASVDNGSHDPDGDSITTAQSPAGPYPVGTTTVTLTVTDSRGATSQCTATVTVNAPTPTVAITGPPSGAIYAVNTPVNFTGTFSDLGGTAHTASWQFQSATTNLSQPGAVNESDRTVSATQSFATAGVYLVTLSVRNHCGGEGQTTLNGDLTQLVVIYDPGAGFVTGGGWINSPLGAYAVDPTLTGKANFGFVSKYQNGAHVPTGQTEFQFKAGNLNFHSTVYEWLVVAGARAQYKGSGKINGAGDYRFMLTAIDGQINGGGGVDRFRIKIWNNNGGGVIYDNQMGADDNSNPTTALGGGNIVIHK